MAAPSLVPSNPASRRAFPRYALDVSLDVIALQSGIPYNMPGRCCDLSETGLAAVIAGELIPGQAVALELRLPHVGLPVRARALVRYQARMRCGLQFVGLTVEQREKVRYWAAHSAASPVSIAIDISAPLPSAELAHEPSASGAIADPAADDERRQRRLHARRRRFLVLLALVVALAGLGWWQWQKAWGELEAITARDSDPPAEAALRLPQGIMDRQITYKVDPIYPDIARQEGLQGLVVLNAVISPEGTVKRLRPLAGADVLAQAAMEAVQSWRYAPYRVQGRPVEVETTISIDFRLP